MEQWKDVEGYEGFYQVSDLGRVKRLKLGNETILSNNSKSQDGYILVDLCKDGNKKTFRVSRLVAIAFIPNPENKPQVNHKDENKENNCVWNLEWCDGKYNCNYGTRNERMLKNRNGKTALKKVMCVETRVIYDSSCDAQRKTGINQAHIIDCCKGNRKTTGGYRWKYAE